jgi:peptidoglycan/LPS O-acetylase OafA/YrhL
MVSLQTPAVTVATWRDRVAAGLMLLVTLGALIAFVTAISAVATANPATQVVEIWRMYGFIVFAGLFMLLAFWPRRYAGIWELVILNKVALSITGLVLLGRGATDAQTILIFDGSLAVITIVAYVLAKGYTAWKRASEK